MFRYFRKVILKFNQPLSKKPKNSKASVSDLFLWINDNTTKTHFNLVDIRNIFNNEVDSSAEQTIYLKVYCQDGSEISTTEISSITSGVKKIRLDLYLKDCRDDFGSFAIFYKNPPDIIVENESFLAERGYVSYANDATELRSFVHGNLDVIAMHPDLSTELLGCSGLLSREFNLQYEFGFYDAYELYFVNPTYRKISVLCQVINLYKSTVLEEFSQEISVGGVGKFHIQNKYPNSFRIVIRSNLVMARPIIVCRSSGMFDVFHG